MHLQWKKKWVTHRCKHGPFHYFWKKSGAATTLQSGVQWTTMDAMAHTAYTGTEARPFCLAIGNSPVAVISALVSLCLDSPCNPLLPRVPPSPRSFPRPCSVPPTSTRPRLLHPHPHPPSSSLRIPLPLPHAVRPASPTFSTIARLRLRFRPRHQTPPSPAPNHHSHIPSRRNFNMRFDRFRRRMPSPANPLPSSPSPPAYINHQEDISSVSASPSLRASHCASQQPESTPTTRSSYIRALEARMEQMEKVPTSSFYHSYAGEFDVSCRAPYPPISPLSPSPTSSVCPVAARSRF